MHNVWLNQGAALSYSAVVQQIAVLSLTTSSASALLDCLQIALLFAANKNNAYSVAAGLCSARLATICMYTSILAREDLEDTLALQGMKQSAQIATGSTEEKDAPFWRRTSVP